MSVELMQLIALLTMVFNYTCSNPLITIVVTYIYEVLQESFNV